MFLSILVFWRVFIRIGDETMSEAGLGHSKDCQWRDMNRYQDRTFVVRF